ncbi:MAG TPA: hydrogenase 2 operon protein HybA [Thermoanaerobaculaceae bacterium]|nr:hydrogenase 2 operon protein HybA [Thermoanaerobaculaceae bacterium]
MAVNRRAFLKGAAVAGAGAAAAVVSSPAEAREKRAVPADAVGMLYDAALCIGCKTCVVACKQANGNPPDTSTMGALYDAPTSLNSKTRNVIKLYEEGGQQSYMKAQCMHCVDPACINACMMGSLAKREFGIVTWHGERCTGCRYCGIACPYGVPTYEFHKAWPGVVKCEMCHHRVIKGLQPACCEVCPRHAVIFGQYPQLLAEAKRRLAEHPDRYEPRVFGESDGGGTQVLYLSKAGIGFDKLGLPSLGAESVPATQQDIQHALYQGFAAPAVLLAVFGGVVWRNRRMQATDDKKEGRP